MSRPHPFTNREALESKVLRVFESQITEVENCSKPIIPKKRAGFSEVGRWPLPDEDVLISRKVCGSPNTKNSGTT